MKTSKTRFFKLLRKAALPTETKAPGKSPQRAGGCSGKRTRQRTSASAED